MKTASKGEFKSEPCLTRIDIKTVDEIMQGVGDTVNGVVERWIEAVYSSEGVHIMQDAPGTTLVHNEADVKDLWFFALNRLFPQLLGEQILADLKHEGKWPLKEWSAYVSTQLPAKGMRTCENVTISWEPPQADAPKFRNQIALVIEAKFDEVLDPLITSKALANCCGKELEPYKDEGENKNTEAQARGVWEQVWSQMCRYQTDYAMITTSRVVILCRRVGEKGHMVVSSPCHRFERSSGNVMLGSILIKASTIFRFIGAACFDALQKAPCPIVPDGNPPTAQATPQANKNIQQIDGTRKSIAYMARYFCVQVTALRQTLLAAMAALRWWAAGQAMLTCHAIHLCRADGSRIWTVQREQPSTCVQKVAAVIGWCPQLRFCEVALGAGISGTVWSGWLWGRAFAVKTSHPEVHRAAAEEWEALQPVLKIARQFPLPIPIYYGLFSNCEKTSVLVMSDAGDNLQSLEQPLDEGIRTKWEEAIQTMEDAGVQITDVREENAVWDGERVTLVDFIDPNVL